MATRISSLARPSMRKEPRQARSKATVAAIVQAGARILGERGWAGFNTNGVAQAAGVSIGSLYQYFPDKAALVAAIRQCHLDDVLAVLPAPNPHDRPLEQMVDELVAGMIAAHSIHPRLHHVLLELAPPHASGSASAAQAEFEAQYLERYQAIVTAYPRAAHNRAEREVVVQVLSAAMEGVIHSAARNGTLQSPAVKKELVHLVCAYLTPQ